MSAVADKKKPKAERKALWAERPAPGKTSPAAARVKRRPSDFPRQLSILGSTGSIGLSALRLVRAHPDKFSVKALAARRNADLLIRQALEFRPELVCVFDEAKALEVQRQLKRYRIRVLSGMEGLTEAASLPSADHVLFAMAGSAALKPIFSALQAAKTVAIANKEPLVMAGRLLMDEAAKFGASVRPVDSEHSGLWQCLEGRTPESVRRLILTSSGGPFLNRKGSLRAVTPEQALNHPKWKMGPKITIDSATLMNKGLEVIEAAHLFGMPASKIEVLIHPEAVIHAVVEFLDGSHLAQLGVPDMLLPIQCALGYPDRLTNDLPRLDFCSLRKFHFEKPDFSRFPCLRLGYEASDRGGSLPAVLNAANEVFVEAFLNRKIKFTAISEKIEKVMRKHRLISHPCLEDLLDADAWARQEAEAAL